METKASPFLYVSTIELKPMQLNVRRLEPFRTKLEVMYPKRDAPVQYGTAPSPQLPRNVKRERLHEIALARRSAVLQHAEQGDRWVTDTQTTDTARPPAQGRREN